MYPHLSLLSLVNIVLLMFFYFVYPHNILLICVLISALVMLIWFLSGIKRIPLSKNTKGFYYQKYPFGKWRYVFQQSDSIENCKEYLESLNHYSFVGLQAGYYKTITHTLVFFMLERAKKENHIKLIVKREKPLYKANLLKIRRKLIGKDCTKCKETCKFNSGSFIDKKKQTRNFYYVNFEVE